MFEQPIVSFLLILGITSFIGFGIGLFFFSGSLLKRILLSPIIGYSVISLTTAYVSYAGFGTDKAALPLSIFLAVISIASTVLMRKNINFTHDGFLKFLIPIGLFGLFNAAIVLAPMVLEDVAYLFNDHATYVSVSEYLRDSGYFEPTHREIEFWQDNTWQYQAMHLRMGAQFFVAFFAGISGIANTMFIYPSLLGFVAFMFMLSLGFFYLNLRDARPNLMEIALVLFFSTLPINLNAQNISLGFLPQTMGIVLMIVLLGLAYETFYLKKRNYFLTALLFAALILTYHEITLFYGAVIFTLLMFEFFYRKNRDIRFFLGVIGSHVGAIVFSPIPAREFVMGIQSSAEANTVGWNVPFSLLRYFQMILGQDMHYLLQNGFHRFITIPGIGVTFFYAYLLIRGGFHDEKKEIKQFLLVSFVPFVAALWFFAYLIFNPFTGQLGHSWRIFKLISWSYWVIPILIGMVAYAYFKESKIKKIVVAVTIFALLPSVRGNVVANYNNQKYEMELYTGNYEDPYEDFRYIAENKDAYSPANIIPYLSHPNYPYLILSILKDVSVGDLNIFGSKLVPSTDAEFYTWVNYRREHDGTQEPLTVKAGFLIYPRKSSTVYLFDGFVEREVYGSDHLAWLTSDTGTIKVIVPDDERAQFSTYISNWQAVDTNVEITLNDAVVFDSTVGQTPVKFVSPIFEKGNHLLGVKYSGQLRVPDANDGRTLGLMFKNTVIQSVE